MNCVYVKFTDLDPVAAIRQAFVEQQIGIPETTPADAPLSTLLAGVAQSDAKPLVLLLDQFEQFFVHFKRESRRRPFVRELNEWYRNGRTLPIKILICIRGDFLWRLSELQEAMGYSLGPQQKFRLKKSSSTNRWSWPMTFRIPKMRTGTRPSVKPMRAGCCFSSSPSEQNCSGSYRQGI
jgi:hypothetical protein